MKRFFLMLIALTAVLTVFAACRVVTGGYDESGFVSYPIDESDDGLYLVSNPPPARPAPERGSEPVSDWDGLRLYVAAGSVTPTGARLSIINYSDTGIGYGTMYSIERYSDGEWRELPHIADIAWTLPLFHINPGSTADENIRWDWIYGELPPGRYRFVRNFIQFDPYDFTPMWQREIPDAYLYAVFTIYENPQAARYEWQREQDAVAAAAFARFEGLDLEITAHSSRGLSFTLTNNNPNYSYIIDSIFMGWEDIFPEGGHASAVEYFIYSPPGFISSQWPFGETRLAPGDSIALDVDWYYNIGELAPRTDPFGLELPYPNVYRLVLDVLLDVDEEYSGEHFRHRIPGIPGIGHRITALFEV